MVSIRPNGTGFHRRPNHHHHRHSRYPSATTNGCFDVMFRFTVSTSVAMFVFLFLNYRTISVPTPSVNRRDTRGGLGGGGGGGGGMVKVEMEGGVEERTWQRQEEEGEEGEEGDDGMEEVSVNDGMEEEGVGYGDDYGDDDRNGGDGGGGTPPIVLDYYPAVNEPENDSNSDSNSHNDHSPPNPKPNLDGNSFDDMEDLHKATIRSRIIDEFTALFTSTLISSSSPNSNNNNDDNLPSSDRYEHLWSIYDREGSYYDLWDDTDSPQGKAFRFLTEDARIAAGAVTTTDGNALEGGGNGTTTTSTTVMEDVWRYAQSLWGGGERVGDGSDNPTLVQRYVLAVLYFSTLGGSDGVDGDGGDDNDANTDGVNEWTSRGNLGFVSHGHECTWSTLWRGTQYGVKCCKPDSFLADTMGTLLGGGDRCGQGGKWEVTQLFLPELKLGGTLPEEIGFLTKLRVLDVQTNRLEGGLPQSLGLLTDLRYLGLGQNSFTGTVPDTMKSLTNLETLYLNFNKMDGGDYLTHSICPLRQTSNQHLYSLWTDCNRPATTTTTTTTTTNDDYYNNGETYDALALNCPCCDVCCDGKRSCVPTARPPHDRRDFEDYEDDGGSGEEDNGWRVEKEEEEEGGEVGLDGDGDGDDGGGAPPIVSRNKRARQKKEEKEHQSEGWYLNAWKGLTR